MKPLLVGEEINSRLVCQRLQEFVIVGVVCSLHFSVWLFCCGRQDETIPCSGALGKKPPSAFSPLRSLPFTVSVIFLLPLRSFSFSCLARRSVSNSSADQPEAGSQAKYSEALA